MINIHFFTHIPLPTPIIVPAGTQNDCSWNLTPLLHSSSRDNEDGFSLQNSKEAPPLVGGRRFKVF